MNKLLLAFSIIFVCFNSNCQDITKIQYQASSAFGGFPDRYIIDINKRTITRWNFIDSLKSTKRKISNKQLNQLNNILLECNFNGLDKETSSQIDGTNYFLKIFYNNNELKEFKAWNNYRSKEFILIESFVHKFYR